MNSKYIIKFNTGFRVLLCCIAFISLYACEKDQHVKPVAGPFAVTSTIPSTIPQSGGTYTLTIDATTNGWWIEIPNNVNWITFARKYGSATSTQNVKIGANTSNADRTLVVTINATSGEKETIQIKQLK